MQISELETSLQVAFDELILKKQPKLPVEVAERLHAPGLRVSVKLQKNGRKRKSNASADCWSPLSGEIVISFKQDGDLVSEKQTATPQPQQYQHSQQRNHNQMPNPNADQDISTTRVDQLCAILDKVERTGRVAGKQFIALKWFRDIALANSHLDWAHTPADRQSVLTEAIRLGRVLTSRIFNPKTPLHPTTTIYLNRGSTVEAQALPPASRFHPVPNRGEPLSQVISNDRGLR